MTLLSLLLTIWLLVPASVFGNRGDDYRIDKGQYYHEAACSYNELSGLTGECVCAKYSRRFDSFVCKCKDNVNSPEEQYICSCDKYTTDKILTDCRCINLKGSLENLNCSLTSNTEYSKEKGTILLGVLVPFNLGDAQLTSYYSGKYYASAMFLALDDVNNNKDLLPNHKLELVWADTNCDWKKTIKLQLTMMKEQNVDAFIGGGCRACEATARNAGAENIPFISHVSPFLSIFVNFLVRYIIITKLD